MSDFRILSIDGGGIRGVIPAVWLCALQTELDIHDSFDLFVGTSTGTIIAAALAGNTKTPKEILQFYSDTGPRVFSPRKRTLRGCLTLARYRTPKYDAKSLESALKTVFKADTLEMLTKPLLATAFDVLNRQPFIFNSKHNDHRSIHIRDVCRASSAAPTYFPGFPVSVAEAILPLIDGGVSANNPTALAVSLAIKQGFQARQICVLSLGTGNSKNPISIQSAKNWGPLHWMRHIVDVLFEGNSGVTDEVVSAMLPNENYFRWQIDLDKSIGNLDDVGNIESLKAAAQGFLGSPKGQRELANVVARLRQTAPLLPYETQDSPTLTPLQSIRYARDRWVDVFEDCIRRVDVGQHTEICRRFLRAFVRTETAEGPMKLAQEELRTLGVSWVLSLQLLTNARSQFLGAVQVYLRDIDGEVRLLSDKVNQAKAWIESAKGADDGTRTGTS